MSNGMPSAEECLKRLREGNERFVKGDHARTLLGWNPKIVEGQQPFAVVLACSDSRSPAELVFDQHLGDLFVIRIAGNVIAPSGIGSVEFAVEKFGTPLVVVMGHTRCGAIAATVEALELGESPASKNLRSITDRISPHIEGLVRVSLKHGADRQQMMREAGRANIVASTSQLRHGSAILESAIGSGKVMIVGAEYELETGRVDFFDVRRP